LIIKNNKQKLTIKPSRIFLEELRRFDIKQYTEAKQDKLISGVIGTAGIVFFLFGILFICAQPLVEGTSYAAAKLLTGAGLAFLTFAAGYAAAKGTFRKIKRKKMKNKLLKEDLIA
jgi:hypothetical protein